ncbi:metal ABC transporter permease [Nibricoccus sp. IMCC34717]|uniref:metal ABC transporter permease n=1 Tax=Nibricoccus sp. IMCC34717 TaxID=3034021 RepID=UPI00384D3259
MIETLLVPFQYEYMVKALAVSALIGGVCGLLSCFVTLKGWSLLGDALSHAVVPGVAIAYLIGAPFALGAFLSGLLAAVGMGFVRTRTALREDVVIGVVFTAFFALGLLLISLYPSGISLKTIIFGNVLAIANEDIVQVIIISVVTLLVIGLRVKDLVLYCFDPLQARALGLNTRALHFTLLILLAATTVAAMQAVGATLVIATLVTPGATAYLLTDRFSRMLWIGGGFGAATGFIGAYASYHLDGSTGGCIVVLQTLGFLAALVFAPKHGLLVHRRTRRAALKGVSP